MILLNDQELMIHLLRRILKIIERATMINNADQEELHNQEIPGENVFFNNNILVCSRTNVIST